MSDEGAGGIVVRGPWANPAEMTEVEFLMWLQDHLTAQLRTPRVITLNIDVYLPA